MRRGWEQEAERGFAERGFAGREQVAEDTHASGKRAGERSRLQTSRGYRWAGRPACGGRLDALHLLQPTVKLRGRHAAAPAVPHPLHDSCAAVTRHVDRESTSVSLGENLINLLLLLCEFFALFSRTVFIPRLWV